MAFVLGQLSPSELARVEQHLDGCEDCLAVVAAAAPDSRGADEAASAPDPMGETAFVREIQRSASDPRLAQAEKRVGTVLRGKYRLESVLGLGGMAAVYRATHRNRAEYAIKVLLPEYSSNLDVRRRFLREGYAANSVKHPGALSVIDDDVDEDGSAFLVLELLRGIACNVLASRLQRSLPADASVAVALQTLDVLAAAHARGVIHRDIKPGNLFIQSDGTLKVLDFGIARVQESLSDSHSTATGVVLGTPAFMAPEQAFRASRPIDERVDIWALGATLYFLLSGHTVRGHMSRGLAQAGQLAQPKRLLTLAASNVPPDLVGVVERALSVEPENRWGSAEDMRQALLAAASRVWGEPPSRTVLAEMLAKLHAGTDSTLPSSVGAEREPADVAAENVGPSPSSASSASGRGLVGSAVSRSSHRLTRTWVGVGLGIGVVCMLAFTTLVRGTRAGSSPAAVAVGSEPPVIVLQPNQPVPQVSPSSPAHDVRAVEGQVRGGTVPLDSDARPTTALEASVGPPKLADPKPRPRVQPRKPPSAKRQPIPDLGI